MTNDPSATAAADGGFSAATLIERVGDPETARDVGRVFRRDADKLLARLDAAMDAHDASEVARVGHRIRGSASMLGAERLSNLGAELERMSEAAAANAEQFGPLATVLATLRSEYSAVFGVIDGYLGDAG